MMGGARIPGITGPPEATGPPESSCERGVHRYKEVKRGGVIFCEQCGDPRELPGCATAPMPTLPPRGVTLATRRVVDVPIGKIRTVSDETPASGLLLLASMTYTVCAWLGMLCWKLMVLLVLLGWKLCYLLVHLWFAAWTGGLSLAAYALLPHGPRGRRRRRR